MALFYQRHFHTLYFMSSRHAMLWVLLPYFSHTQNHHINYRTWRFIGPQQPGRVWSINWLLYWAGRGNGASSLWWSPPSLWNRWEKRRVFLEVERKDSTNLSDLISIDFIAIFFWSFTNSSGCLYFFGTLQDQVQHFNARAEDYHRRHGDEESPFQACLLGTAQRDETIIENAVGGEYCSSTSVLFGFLES